MDENLEISEKERERRRKISEYRKKAIKKKRERGLKEYNKRRKKEKERKEREKEKEKLRKKKEIEKNKHKRRVGRPKKRGPKKKRRNKPKTPKIDKRKMKPSNPIRWKIVMCRNKKQTKVVGKFRNFEDACEFFSKLKDCDKEIVFPMEYTGTGGNTSKSSIDEYIFIEKSDTEPMSFRNEYGKIVKHETNLEEWVIIDKFQFKKEETFWVFGYDNHKDRKTFVWIYDNIIQSGIYSSFDMNIIYTYKNKLVIQHDDGSIDLVICKNSYDSTRMYNLLQGKIKKDKIKQVVFIGDKGSLLPSDKSRRKVEDAIIELTGWSLEKVRMNGNTYYYKNK